MRFLLNLVYVFLGLFCLPLIAWKALRTGKYRKGWGHKLLGRVPPCKSDDGCIWLHAVSVGEVNLLPGLVAQIQQREPDAEIAISTTTDSGFALAQKRFPDNSVFYCPLDFSWAVSAAMKRLRPRMLVLSELEVWPNLIGIAAAGGVKVAVVNGRLSEQSFRGYQKVRFALHRTFARLSLVLAQTEEYAERFETLGTSRSNIVVTGSIKFDGARTDRHASDINCLRELVGLNSQHRVWLVGSTQAPEEQYALEIFDRLRREFSDLRLIIVPRHPERFDTVADWIDSSPDRTLVRRTALDRQDAPQRSDWLSNEVLLLDTIGELGRWWGLADFAFVGGSFGNRGGQNMLEPAAYGAAVSFGPNTKNFRDIVAQLMQHDAAVRVREPRELSDFVRDCLLHPEEASARGRRAQQIVIAGQGAIDRTAAAICDLLNSEAPEKTKSFDHGSVLPHKRDAA